VPTLKAHEMVARKAPNARSAASSTRKASRSSATPVGEDQAEPPSLREKLRLLYFGKSETAHRFRYGLLVFDIGTIIFIIGTSFMARPLTWLDLIFGFLRSQIM
jgi:voltage-gated potassium channel